jgi:hypothetical protein
VLVGNCNQIHHKKSIAMKSLFVIAVCIAAIGVAGKINGQQANRSLIVDNMQSLHMSTGHPNNVHIKAMRDFLKRNKTAGEVKWIIIDKGYVVKYSGENKSRCRTVYNSKGNYLYTVKQYNEDAMPREVRKLLKSQYYDYAISLVEEIHVPAKPVIYLVHVQDETSLKNIRVCEGEMEVIEEYQKDHFVQRIAGSKP